MERDFRVWQRQHALGVILLISRNTWRLVKAFWPLLLPLWLRGSDEIRYGALAGGVAGFALIAFTGLQFWRFQFRLRPGALHVKSGVFQRKRLVIPFDRIQAVQFAQNPLQRVLGLTGLTIDTAGTTGNELELMALKLSTAESLRDALVGRKENAPAAAASVKTEASAHPTPGPDLDPSPSQSEPLVQYGWRDLVRVAMAQNHLRNGLIALSAPMILVSQFDGLVESWVGALPWWAPVLLSLLWVILWLPALVCTTLLGVVASLVVVCFKYFDLKLKVTESRQFQVQAGLIKRFAFSIQRSKIQTAKWTSTPLSRSLGMSFLQWSQASAGAAQLGAEQRLRIPGVEAAQQERINRELFPDWRSEGPLYLRPIAVYPMLRWLRWWVPSVTILWVATGAWWSICIAALILAFGGVASFREARLRGVRLSDMTMGAEAGWWKRMCTLTQFHQVQRVEVRQSFWHAYRGIAHLELHTAAGSICLRFLNEQEARDFADYVLMRVESSKVPWM